MGTSLVGEFELEGGEHVWVVKRETGIPVLNAGSTSASKFETRWNEVGPEDRIRAILFGWAEDGSRFMYEARVEGWPPVRPAVSSLEEPPD